MESVKSFPDAARKLSRGGSATLALVPVVFAPAFVLQVALICADVVCLEEWGGAGEGAGAGQPPLLALGRRVVCDYTGTQYLTSRCVVLMLPLHPCFCCCYYCLRPRIAAGLFIYPLDSKGYSEWVYIYTQSGSIYI